MAINVRKQVANYLAKKSLAAHSTGSISYYLCLFMQTQFHLGRYIHAYTNETYSLVNLQDLIPTLAGLCSLSVFMPAKVGIKSSRFARERVSFVHA